MRARFSYRHPNNVFSLSIPCKSLSFGWVFTFIDGCDASTKQSVPIHQLFPNLADMRISLMQNKSHRLIRSQHHVKNGI